MLAAAIGEVVTASDVPAVSLLESVVTVGGFLAFVGLLVGVQTWAFRRRRRGEEASRYDGRGAEVMLGNWFT